MRTLRRTADRLRIDIVVFSDMSVEDVARECDQPLLQARLAKLREYSERFLVLDSVEKTRKRLFGALKSEGLRCIPLERYRPGRRTGGQQRRGEPSSHACTSGHAAR